MNVFFFLLFLSLSLYISISTPVVSDVAHTHSPISPANIPNKYPTRTTKNNRNSKSAYQKGVRFDPDIPQTIRLEFAKSNTKVSKPKQQNSSPPAAAPHPTLLHPLTGREYHSFNHQHLISMSSFTKTLAVSFRFG